MSNFMPNNLSVMLPTVPLPIVEVRDAIRSNKLNWWGIRENFRLSAQRAIGLNEKDIEDLKREIKVLDLKIQQAIECEELLNRCYRV